MLKQARAYGLGVVLATQNPVDLDYKGLANTGTWFIGRLQTERDKARVLEGLEGAAASSVKKFNRQGMEEALAGLGNRVFLMNNVHEDAPEVFQTRWTLSYLRGPLTRTQIKSVMEPLRPAVGVRGKVVRGRKPENHRLTRIMPHLSPAGLYCPRMCRSILFLSEAANRAGSALIYQPMLLGASQVRVADSKAGVDVTQDVTVLVPISDGAVAMDWDHAIETELAIC